MEVYLAQPRGFCAGVVRAIEIVERALQKYGPPVYVRHEIVHNKYVVESLKNKGAIFVEDLSEVPPLPSPCSAPMAWPRSVEEEAAVRGLPVLNATCPLVTKVHNQGKRYMSKGRALILIGHAGHPEVEGTMGQVPGPVLLVQNVDVGGPDAADRHPGGLYHPDHPERGRHKRHNCRHSGPFYRYSRPRHPGYLLCDTESGQNTPIKTRRSVRSVWRSSPVAFDH